MHSRFFYLLSPLIMLVASPPPCLSGSLTLDELTFQNGYRVLYDSDGSTYPSPEWTPTRAVPYIVESDTYFTVRAAFDVEPNTLQAQYEVQGIATIDGATYTFPLQTFSVGGEGNGDAGFFTSLQFLPDSVQTLDNVSTSWVYRKKDTTTWYDAGSSSNNLVFLVLAPPYYIQSIPNCDEPRLCK